MNFPSVPEVGLPQQYRRSTSVVFRETGEPFASDAIDDLRAAVRIRVVGQHAAAAGKLQAALARLGLAFPITDWGGAWQQLCSRCVQAINTIREELEAIEISSTT